MANRDFMNVSGSTKLPAEIAKPYKYFWGAILASLVLLCYLYPKILTILLITSLLSYVLCVAAQSLKEKYYIPGVISVVGIILSFLITVIGGVGALIPFLINQGKALLSQWDAESLPSSLKGFATQAEAAANQSPQVKGLLSLDIAEILKSSSGILNKTSDILFGTLHGLEVFFLIILFSALIAIDGERTITYVRRLVEKRSTKHWNTIIQSTLTELDSKMRKIILGKVKIASIMVFVATACYYVLFAVAGYPSAVLPALIIGCTIGVMSIIPFVGAVVSGLAGGLFAMAILADSHVIFLIMPVVLVGVLAFFEGKILTIKIIGNQINVSAFVVLFNFFLMATLLGVTGIIMSEYLLVFFLTIPQLYEHIFEVSREEERKFLEKCQQQEAQNNVVANEA